MAKIKTECEACSKEFNPKKNLASKRAITLAGAGAGAVMGGKMGIVAGPYGAIAGTVPGSIAGATAGHLLDNKWVTCPHCDETQTVG